MLLTTSLLCRWLWLVQSVVGDTNEIVKLRNDERKIKSMEDAGHPHRYDRITFRPWTGGGYIKSWYELKLPDDTIISHVWPNAGMIKHGGVVHDGTTGVSIRLATTWPY